MITREKAKALLPIIQAYAEGKTIQYLDSEGNWKDYVNPPVFCGEPYRIKPEQKYRPFQTQEECLNEMLKHQPFGWVNDIIGKKGFHNIMRIFNENGSVYMKTENRIITVSESFYYYAFIDGTPFGIKED